MSNDYRIVALLIGCDTTADLTNDISTGSYNGVQAFIQDGRVFVLQNSSEPLSSTVLATKDNPNKRWIQLGAGGGSGTVTTIASPGGTITVTNPAGPVVDIDVQIATGEVASGGAGNLLSSSANFLFDQAARTMTVIGSGTFGVPAMTMDAPAGTFPSFSHRVGGVEQVGDYYLDGVAGGVVYSLTNPANHTSPGGGATMSWTNAAFGSCLLAYPNDFDVGVGTGNIASGATLGLTWITSSNGPASGVPTHAPNFVQMAAMAADHLNSKLYIYFQGTVNAWKSVQLL